MSLHDRLKEACECGEVLRIRYHGGTQPGTVREIYPVQVMSERIMARCLASNAEKMFIVDKIELCPDADLTYKAQVRAKQKVVSYRDIAEFYADCKAELESLGWHIDVDSDGISLCEYFKNGKPRKTPTVSLTYSPFVCEMYVSADGRIHEEERESLRPWAVRAKNMNTRTFKSLGSAAIVFMEQARMVIRID